MNQFNRKLSNACVCLSIHLLLAIGLFGYGSNGTTGLRNVSNDMLAHALEYVEDVHVPNVQNVSTGWRDLIEHIRDLNCRRDIMRDIGLLQTHIADLSESDETAFNDSITQIRTIMQKHPDFILTIKSNFKKRLGTALPSILTDINAKNLSSPSMHTLLSALNINLDRIIYYFQNWRLQVPDFFAVDGLETSSLMIVGLYLHCVLSQDTLLSMSRDAMLPILYYKAYYKTLMTMNGYRAVSTQQTIVWDYTTIQSIPNQIIRRFNGSGTHFIPQLDVHHALGIGEIPVRLSEEYVFWTEFVLDLMAIDEGTNEITFRSRWKWECPVVIVTVAHHHYTVNNMETFDTLIRSLSTIFFRPRSIIEIAQMSGLDTQFRSVVLAKLCSLRGDWKGMSMFDMYYLNCHCSYVGTICIRFFRICTIVVMILLCLYGCWCCIFPSWRVWRLVIKSLILSVFVICIFQFPLFVVPL
eukprot:189068_1